MLAAPPVSPCSFFFTTRTRTTHHHHHHHSISRRCDLLPVSANLQRKKNNRYQHPSPQNYDDDDEEEEEEEIGGIGYAFMKSLKSEILPRKIDAIQNPKPSSPVNSKRSTKGGGGGGGGGGEEKGRVELNGIDVLMALQRAKSQTRSNTTRRKQGKLDMKGSSVRGKEDDDSIMDYRDVKPLNVKSDWGTRLDELEEGLQQLLLLHHKF